MFQLIGDYLYMIWILISNLAVFTFRIIITPVVFIPLSISCGVGLIVVITKGIVKKLKK